MPGRDDRLVEIDDPFLVPIADPFAPKPKPAPVAQRPMGAGTRSSATPVYMGVAPQTTVRAPVYVPAPQPAPPKREAPQMDWRPRPAPPLPPTGPHLADLVRGKRASTPEGAFIRSAGRGAAPALAGTAGFGAGFAAAGTIGAPLEAIPVAGPFLHGGAALAGGVAGAFGAGYVVDKAQDKVLSMLPSSWVRALGQDEAQRAEDAAEHPIASFTGSLAPMLLSMRPGMTATQVSPEASWLTRFMSRPAGGAAVNAGLGAGLEGGREVASGEKVDPAKIAISAGAGAAMNRPTALGNKLFTVGGNTAIRGLTQAVRGAGSAYRGASDLGSTIAQAAKDARDIQSGDLIIHAPQADTPAPVRRALPAPKAEPAPRAKLVPIDDPFAGTPPVTKPPEASSPSLPMVVDPQPVAGGPAAAGGGGLRQGTSEPGEPTGDAPKVSEPPAEPVAPPVLHTADLRPEPGALAEGEHYVTSPAGNRIRSRYEVVDSASLKPAEGELQNRDRSRDTTDLQVNDIVAGFDPTRLGPSAETDRGAPIVGPDGVIESGNGRMLAVNRIYDDPAHAAKAQAYREFIESQGHSTEGIDRPVLIRRRTNDLTPEQRRQFVIDSNKDAKLSMTSVERARSDADGLDGDSLALYRGGDVASAGNADFVKAFNSKLTKSELAGQIDGEGQISQDGITRVENALMARAYENPEVLSKLIEARDNNIRSIGAGMLDNAGGWAKLRADVKEGRVQPAFDITDKLVEAARRVSDIRAAGTKIGDALAQGGMFEKVDPVVESFMRAFYNPELTRAASREAVSSAIETYARRAAEQTTDARLFGGGETTPADIMADILNERNERTGDMFAQAAEDRLDRGVKGTTVYHGGTLEPGADFRFPLFVAEDRPTAQSYADDRGRGKGRVLPLQYHPNKPATAADVSRIAKRILPAAELEQASTFSLIDPEFGGEGAEKVVAALKAEGFDAVEFLDFAIDADEATVPTKAIISSSAISHPSRAANDDWLGDDIEARLADRRERRMARRGLSTEKTDGDATERAARGNEGRDARSSVEDEEGQDGSAGQGRDPAGRLQEGLNETPDYSVGRHGPLFDAYDPDFATASYTNRASIYNTAAEALGIDPNKFTLMPAPRQVSLLADAIKLKFGVEVAVDPQLQERFAIDQMLDAFQNVQGMAYVLDLPTTAISLGGRLKLRLQKGGRFLGSYQPVGAMITLPQRSNSFAHEWGHAVDYHLLREMTDADGRGLSGAIRAKGEGADRKIGAPANVREAFVDLLNSMFFDKAAAAHRIMQLEAKLAATGSAKVKAEMTAQLARLKDGSSQAQGIRSAFYKGAKSFDGPGGDYWTSPTEMFARAFEAYVSYKVEAAGLTTEFIGKGDAAYLSNADERFAKTFPKGEERADIFAAFEQVFGHIADAQILGKGAGAEKPAGSVRRMTDYDKTPVVAHERGIINREMRAIKQQLRQRAKEIAGRSDDPKGLGEKIKDLNGVTFMSMTGNLRMIQGRSKSPALQKLIDLLTKQDGRGDRTVARTFAEDVHLQSKQAINRLGNIIKANGLGDLSAEDTMVLRDLLVGARDDAPAGKGNLVKGAAAIRHVLDNEFYVNQQAGIDLGYTRNGYLARVLDLPKVYSDQPGFTRQAAKVYDLVFDREFGTDPDKLLADTEGKPAGRGFAGDASKLATFMKTARMLAKNGATLPSLEPVRKLQQQIAKLEKAGDDEGAAKLQVKLSDLFGDLMDEVKPVYAKERAEAWLAKINLVAGQEHNASSPDSGYTKKRDLPAETDKIMEKYFLADPIESVTNYLVTSARRTAYARRFGADGKKRSALFEQMAAEGVSPDDQRTVERILDTATGRRRSSLPRSFEKAAAFVNAAGTMALLPRAVLSSLAEPFTAGLVTGDASSGFKLMGNMIGQAVKTADGRARYELVRAIGIIDDAASSDIMEARYGQTYADTTRWDRYTSTMFRRTGLTWLTRAQKTALVGYGHAFFDSLSGKMLAGGKAGADAEALLRELGVRDPKAFAKEILQQGRMPTPEELESDFGYDYSTAQLRFSDMVVQNPGAMDRPELSQNPVGRVVYGITGFSYGYWRNIIKRNGILLAETARRGGAGRSALYGSALFASAATAYLAALVISSVRERLLNPKRWHELEDKGELESTMAQLAFTRTFAFGAADTAIQTYSGLKYQRDPANMFVGAGPAFILGNLAKMQQPFAANNSRKTNSAEYNAVQGLYSNASPFLAFALARVPGGPVVDVATGVGMAYVTSPAARDAVATAVVGPKNGSVGADGKKVRSGPTRFDAALDGVFGPKESSRVKKTADAYSR